VLQDDATVHQLREAFAAMAAKNQELEQQVDFLERDNHRLMQDNLRIKDERLDPIPSSTPLAATTAKTSRAATATSASKARRRASRMSIAMKPRASMTASFESILNENQILASNIQDFIKNLAQGQYDPSYDEDQLVYTEGLSCMLTLFHHRFSSLQQSSSPQRSIPQPQLQLQPQKRQMNRIFAEVVRFISSLIQEASFRFEDFSFSWKWLFKSFPDNHETRNGRGWLPLHWYLTIPNPSIADITFLYELYGEDAFEEAVSPLSVLAANCNYDATSGANMNPETKQPILCDAIRELLRLRADAAADRDADGSIGLMHACAANHSSTAVLDLLYQSNPQIINQSDNFGCYAIHYACFFGNLLSIRYLFERAPDCAKIPSGNGALALHEAVQNTNHQSLELVIIVYQQYPAAISIEDHQGALPLHLAARSADLAIVRYLYELDPKTIIAKDKEGLTPMHYSSQRAEKNVQVIEYLSTAAKAAASTTSSSKVEASPKRIQEMMSSLTMTWTKKS
jgi:ankyrin repeat protein